jgi:hypothetical protein
MTFCPFDHNIDSHMATLSRIEFDIRDGCFSWNGVDLKIALVLYRVSRSPLTEQVLVDCHGIKSEQIRHVGNRPCSIGRA